MSRSRPSAPERRPATAERPPLEIHRSPRRRRSASAAFRDDRIVVRLPAGLPAREEDELLAGLLRKVTDRHRAETSGGDDVLVRRAAQLADTYLDGVRASSVRWSSRMGARHGSCTPDEGSIRISLDLARHPAYVRDYVLVHELAHLQVPGHSAAFHALVDRFPQAERARGYLDGYAAGRFTAATTAADDGGTADPSRDDGGTADPSRDDGAAPGPGGAAGGVSATP